MQTSYLYLTFVSHRQPAIAVVFQLKSFVIKHAAIYAGEPRAIVVRNVSAWIKYMNE